MTENIIELHVIIAIGSILALVAGLLFVGILAFKKDAKKNKLVKEITKDITSYKNRENGISGKNKHF